jgi:hypothetical protein
LVEADVLGLATGTAADVGKVNLGFEGEAIDALKKAMERGGDDAEFFRDKMAGVFGSGHIPKTG